MYLRRLFVIIIIGILMMKIQSKNLQSEEDSESIEIPNKPPNGKNVKFEDSIEKLAEIKYEEDDSDSIEIPNKKPNGYVENLF